MFFFIFVLFGSKFYGILILFFNIKIIFIFIIGIINWGCIFSKGFVVYFYEVFSLFISGYKFKLNKYLFKINGFWGGFLNFCVNVYFFLYFLNILDEIENVYLWYMMMNGSR